MISGSLQYCLENHFRDALTSGNSESLRQCLRAYSIIDKIHNVEELFRRLTVKPYMSQVLSCAAVLSLILASYNDKGKVNGTKVLYTVCYIADID